MNEESRILALSRGEIPPANGLEKHFLKAIAGEALPCTQEEIRWFKIWEKDVAGKSFYQTDNFDDADAFSERITVLSSENNALHSKINFLQETIQTLEQQLTVCHRTIAKYETPPKVLITDIEKDAHKMAIRHAENSSFIVYSSIDGQE